MMIDARSARFAAAITAVVLMFALLNASALVMLAQAMVFAISAWRPQLSPYGMVYRTLVAPRLGPPQEWEHQVALRFAQTAGLAFATVSTLGYFVGADLVGLAFAGFAFVAASLNAAFGLCIACKIYPLYRRVAMRVSDHR